MKRRLKAFRFKAALKWLWRVLLLLVLLDFAYLMAIWPNWKDIESGPVPQSAFIQTYVNRLDEGSSLPKLRWDPVSFQNIPKSMVRAVVVAEDARFFYHNGFDTDAFVEVMKYNLAKRKFLFGGSTISQQTVKNLFLSPSRNPLRKWHELVITLSMERNLSKQQIMALYLNVAEFGQGVYGVEAASQFYWNKPASKLSSKQAIELAASLPSPLKHNPSTRTKSFFNRVRKIEQYF
jgi:monofunctional biosynthetic peptidoglycan transglycosylase